MSDYPFQRILLATEHTEFDVGAERIAFAMARRCAIPLRVVVPLLSNAEYEVAAPEFALRAEQEVALKVTALRNSAKELGVELDVHVRRGAEASQEIVAEAADSKADLIVIRRRGKPSFLANLLVGEMVSKVIRDAHCAVLTVPRAAEFWRNEVLAAVSETPAAEKISVLAALVAAVCDMPLTVVSVAESQATQAKTESFNNRIVALASAQTNRVQGRVMVGEPVAQILATVQEKSADLIVIGRQRYHHFPFTHGGKSIMQKIAGALDMPTLIVPD